MYKLPICRGSGFTVNRTHFGGSIYFYSMEAASELRWGGSNTIYGAMLSGAIFSYLELYGAIWCYLTLYGAIWGYVA